MKNYGRFLAIGVLALAVSGPVLANPTIIGGPNIGNSWSIAANAGGTYDLWAIRISPVSLGIDTFKVGSPALQTATPGWNMVVESPSLVWRIQLSSVTNEYATPRC